jgi:X-X-X-Leu-X-X-Gly heptad repeat protein
MTFEEMQQIIQGMLSVQRGLQESQLRLESGQAQLVDGQAQLTEGLNQVVNNQAQLAEGLGRLTDVVGRYVTASTTAIEHLQASVGELRAGQEHQARVLDYLLRKEQERQNGG